MRKPFRKNWDEPFDRSKITATKLVDELAQRVGRPGVHMKTDDLLIRLIAETVISHGLFCRFAKELFGRMDDMQSSLDSLNRH